MPNSRKILRSFFSCSATPRLARLSSISVLGILSIAVTGCGDTNLPLPSQGTLTGGGPTNTVGVTTVDFSTAPNPTGVPTVPFPRPTTSTRTGAGVTSNPSNVPTSTGMPPSTTQPVPTGGVTTSPAPGTSTSTATQPPSSTGNTNSTATSSSVPTTGVGSSTGTQGTDTQSTGEAPEVSPGGRDCANITWGRPTRLPHVGAVVPRWDAIGYLDQNRDQKIDVNERVETEIGMCSLHLSDQRCGYIVYTDHDCLGCKRAFEAIGQYRQELARAKVGVYAIHFGQDTATDFERITQTYAGGYVSQWSTKPNFNINTQPWAMLVDLKTMKVLRTTSPQGGFPNVQDAAAICTALGVGQPD